MGKKQPEEEEIEDLEDNQEDLEMVSMAKEEEEVEETTMISETAPMITKRFGGGGSSQDDTSFDVVVEKGKMSCPRRHSLNVNSNTTFLARWSIPIVLSYLLLGTLVFVRTEGWSLRDALYFCVTVLTTVGYGDLAPKTAIAKAFCCAYVICGVSMVSASLGVVLGRMQAKVQTTQLFAAAGDRHVSSLLSALSAMVCVILMGAVFGHAKEGWSILDSIYWAIITCTSVGLGDLTPSPASRLESLMYLLVAVGVFAASAGSIVHVFADMEVQKAVSAFVADGVTEDIIAEMDEDGGGSVDKFEFLSYMLVHTGKVSKHEIQSINTLFSSLDRDGSGSLDTNDIRDAIKSGNLRNGPPAKKQAEEKPKEAQKTSVNDLLWSSLTKIPESIAKMFQLPQISQQKAVDGCFAALSLAGSVAFLWSIDTYAKLPFKLFAPPMLSSAIIFFAGTHPPPPAAFITGTLGAFVLGTLLHQFGLAGSLFVQCMAASLLLLFFKLSGSIFVPTVGLAAFIAQSEMDHTSSLRGPLMFLVTTWAAGHLFLYYAAYVLSNVRQKLRTSMATAEWKARLAGKSGPEHERELREIFDKYDTSGDGQLDASELKLALRAITGNDMDVEDCEKIIRSMDTDGDGVIDFHEFKQAMEEHA